ncbi:MAG: hypothetical protein AAGM38_11045 [Pseudomonadota bacterium]
MGESRSSVSDRATSRAGGDATRPVRSVQNRFAADGTPVEIVDVMSGASVVGAARPEKAALGSAEAAARKRAGRLSQWLRDGGAPEARPSVDAGLAAFRRASAARAASRDDGAERRADARPVQRPVQSNAPSASPAPKALASETTTNAPTPAAQAEADRKPIDPAEALMLRIRVMGGGEISEQVYGPERRWALLDREGRLSDAPDPALATALRQSGRLAFDRFERGAAIYRLTIAAEPEQGSF